MAFVYNIGANIGPLAGFAADLFVPPFAKGGEGEFAFTLAEPPSNLYAFNPINRGIFFANGGGGGEAAPGQSAKAGLAERIKGLRSREGLPEWIAMALDGLAEKIGEFDEIASLERAAECRDDFLGVAGEFFQDETTEKLRLLASASSEEEFVARDGLSLHFEFKQTIFPPLRQKMLFYFAVTGLENPSWQIRLLAARILYVSAGVDEGCCRKVVNKLISLAQSDPSWLVRASAAGAVFMHNSKAGLDTTHTARQARPDEIVRKLLKSGEAWHVTAAFNLISELTWLSPDKLGRTRHVRVIEDVFEAAVRFTDAESKRSYLDTIFRQWDVMPPKLRAKIASDRLTQNLVIDNIRANGCHGYELISYFAPFLSPDRFRSMRDELRHVVMAENPASLDIISINRFVTLLKLGLDGISEEQRLELFAHAVDIISLPEVQTTDHCRTNLIPYASSILSGVNSRIRSMAMASVVQKANEFQREWGNETFYRVLYLLFYLAREVLEFRTYEVLDVFLKAARLRWLGGKPKDTLFLVGSEGGTKNDIILLHNISIQDLSRFTIPPNYYPVLIEAVFINLFVWNNRLKDPQARLAVQLLNDIDSEGTLQQVVNFFRRYNSLPQALRRRFAEEVATDTERSLSGLPPAQREKLGNRLLINPNKAVARLRQFLIRHFTEDLGLPEERRHAVAESIQQNAAVWEQNNFLANLASLLSFSDDIGRQVITDLVDELTSAEVVAKTRQNGGIRFINPNRAESVRDDDFDGDFNEKWTNGDKDFVIPLGELESGSVIKDDPLALKRSRYSFTLRQLAGHLNITGVSHMAEPEIADALKEKLTSQTVSVTGYVDWASKMGRVLEKMKRLDDISETELEGLADFVNSHAEALKNAFGSVEIYHDLLELRRNINASALEGKAWLVISSDPAGFLNIGREPVVTCQDPTRDTGHAKSGQPVNRAYDGRFRYAAIYMDDSMKVQNGIAIPGKHAKLVARAHLEVTLDGEAPKLLVERLYSAGGFVYPKLVAGKLRGFAEGSLGLDRDRDVFIQFDNLGAYPPPLPDDKPIYRDTFHR